MPAEYDEDLGSPPGPSIDLLAALTSLLRRWKLIAAITMSAVLATYGLMKIVPSGYTSTVEILIFDPEQQIDAAVQKPISPFVDAIGYDAMNTEIDVIKSKSVALRVAKELRLDDDPEFQPRNWLAELMASLGFARLATTYNDNLRAVGGQEEQKAEKLDQAADALRQRLQVWSESYIIFVSATSQNPIQAQRLAAAVANDYLASQREARQAALLRVANWLKARADDLHSRLLATESSIEKLKQTNSVGGGGLDSFTEPQMRELNTHLMAVRAEVVKRRADLDQARHVVGSNGRVADMISTPSDIQSIPELAASAELTQLRQKQVELQWRATDLQNKLGEHHAEVIAIRAQLAGINNQIDVEVGHIIANLQNAYDIAVRQEQALETNLKKISVASNSQINDKLQQLKHEAEADRTLYESYLSQYNNISERRTLQDATARIISPATLPRSPSSPRRKMFYAVGGMLGLGSGFLLAFLLEYLWSGVKSVTEIEQTSGRSVVGVIPLWLPRKSRGDPSPPPPQFGEAMDAMRIGLELSSTNPKAILITSALPAEGKSTAAMLLAASSASSGRRTVLVNCDLHRHSTAEALRNRGRPGLSEFLRGSAGLVDVIRRDAATNVYVIAAGSTVPNAADLLMSQRMRELIAVLRNEFAYVVMDAPPLLPVIDALALATIADKVLVIVEWGQTPRGSLAEAFKVLRPEAQRVAGIVLNKVSPGQLTGYYGAHPYRSASKYSSNA